MLGNVKVLRKWWKTWKTLPVFSWVRAANLYRAGNYTLAQKYYEMGLKRHPAHPAQYCARLDLAYCLFKNKKFEEAEKQLRAVIAGVPRSTEAYLRLARLQMWTGHALDAAWTMRRAIRELGATPDLVATFLFALFDNGGPVYLLREASEALNKLEATGVLATNVKLRAAHAKLQMLRGKYDEGRKLLEDVVNQSDSPFEAILLFAEVLLEEDEVGRAREELRRALLVASDHPRVLSLLAETYLRSGEFYQSDYSEQLATAACQSTNWLSPREMHILAEAYYHIGDKVAALVMASKAKQVGSRLLGEYRDVKNLERLIESLSTGTLA